MEALSGVASGMAVASLSLQLLESVITIKRFISDVKGASKELKRLTALLDCLHALLEDVRNIMEQQTSLQKEHFPAPSMTIFHCLKSCEDSLTSLQDLTNKYRTQQKGEVSMTSRIKNDVRFGFKMKDIAAIESRIQREIDALNAALNVNSTAILMATVPALMAGVQRCTDLSTLPNPRSCKSSMLISDPSIKQESQAVSEAICMKTQVRQAWTSSALNMLGIYQRKSRCYLRGERSLAKSGTNGIDTVLSESHEILLTWSVLRFGLRWARHSASSVIFSSLSVYPVVQSIWDYDDLIEDGSIDEIQQKFSSGELHPYTRDIDGISLLHLAAKNGRADICRLLVQHGLKSDSTRSLQSPLHSLLLWGDFPSDSASFVIDTTRFLLQQCDGLDDFRDAMLGLDYTYMSTVNCQTSRWLWHSVSALPTDDDVLASRCRILQNLVLRISLSASTVEEQTTVAQIIELTTPEILQHYLWGNFSLLQPFFCGSKSSVDSHGQGHVFLDMLTRLNLDIKACMTTELRLLGQNRMMRQPWLSDPKRRLIFEYLEPDSWILRWVWELDPDASGYLLMSEHAGLGPDDIPYVFDFYYDYFRWPVTCIKPTEGHSYQTRCQERFDRREANKARKERARTRTKLSRKMPGAWSW